MMNDSYKKSRVPNRAKRRSYFTRNSKRTTRNTSRRGVLLLVILGMLTLFLMIGTAFIMSSNQYRRSNKSYSKVGEKKNLQASQTGFLGEVINQIIRDTSNQNSALRFHSLLRDLYGIEGFRGEVLQANYAGATNANTYANFLGETAGQFLELSVFVDPINFPPVNPEGVTDLYSRPMVLNTLPDYYAGQVLTWTTGPLEGKSTRIVKSRFEPIGPEPQRGLTILTVVMTPETKSIPFQYNAGVSPVITELVTVIQGQNFGAEFIVNGRPFNGTGVGYNSLAAPGSAKLNAWEMVPGMPPQSTLSTPLALMPNVAFFDPVSGTSNVRLTLTPNPTDQSYYGTLVNDPPLPEYRFYDGLGGSDESYDAPDFQNMFLAWTGPNLTETLVPNLNPGAVPPLPFNRDVLPNFLGGIVMPSFHRPELINYWAHQAYFLTPGDPLINSDFGAVANNASLLRKVLMRPNWHDHPAFDGSNPEFAEALSNFRTNSYPNDVIMRMIYGPWDVDNDNDGIRDSIWVDFGAPVIVGSKGRLVKPLAAIMVLDMDGRLNVNAHGTRELAGLGGGLSATPFDIPAVPVGTPPGTEWDNVPRGQAFGPAEIDLVQLFGNNNVVQRLMSGMGVDYDGDTVFDFMLPGRYGYGFTNSTVPIDDEPGTKNAYDLSAQLKMQGYPYPNPLIRSNFGTLPDLRSRYKLALNNFGQAVTTWTPQDGAAHSLTDDNPYEMDLSATGPRGMGAYPVDTSLPGNTNRSTNADNPFSPAELERVLRAYDTDSGTLSSRLFDLLRNGRPENINPSDPLYKDQISNYIGDLNSWRTLLTTDSYDLPEPSIQLPAWVKTGLPGVTNSDFVSVMSPTTTDLRHPVNCSFADLIEYRIRAANNWPVLTDDPARLVTIRRMMRMLVAPEMMAGLKLDLNRPLGNGRDDNNNGVVDEPGEFFDVDNDGQLNPSEGEAFWRIDNTRLSTNEQNNVARRLFEDDAAIDVDGNPDTMYGRFRDDYDRDGDGVINRWERGDYLPNNPPATVGPEDGDGSLSLVELVNLHNYRRQLLARHLYVLAMAVVDPLPSTATPDVAKARSRHLAQWAINVVDFRDPDNIMTAFEYDMNPFLHGWFVDHMAANPIPIDGDQATANDIYGNDGKFDTLSPTPPQDQDRGGLVWGLERPEVLMTETLAWHDRATEEQAGDAVTDDNGSLDADNEDEGEIGTQSSPGTDADFNQRVRPQGATFIELYNPWAASGGASADTHSIDPSTGADLGVSMAKVSAVSRPAINGVTTAHRSPVWRINVRKTVDFTQQSIYMGNPNSSPYDVGGPDHDPDDPDNRVRPQIPDRTVYFTNFDPEQFYSTRPKGVAPFYETSWDDDGVGFYSSLTNPFAAVDDPMNGTLHAIVRPGGYMVVGSGEPFSSANLQLNPDNLTAQVARFEAWISERKPNTAPGLRRAIVLNPFATGNQASVLLRDVDKDGVPSTYMDAAGFGVSVNAFNPAPTGGGLNTSVAIIDKVWFRNVKNGVVLNEQPESRRFSVSEPATGYPDMVFNSVTKRDTVKNTILYSPILDIPLDNQRDGKIELTGGERIDGQLIIAPASPRWMKKARPTDALATVELRKDNELRLRLHEDEESALRTIPAFSWLYLQRLANPLLPWNPERILPNGMVNPKHEPSLPVNPYRTVDSIATNVTVFTGQSVDERRRQNGVIKSYYNSIPLETFASFQRGRNNEAMPENFLARIHEMQGIIKTSNTGGKAGMRDITLAIAKSGGFVQNPDSPPLSPQNLWGEERIGYPQNQALPVGVYINKSGPLGNGLKHLAGQETHFMNSMPDCTLGFMNEPYRNAAATTDFDRKFVPTQPFPFIAWNNRPFANPGEIIEVPAFRSSLLPKTFSFAKPGTGANTKGEYSEAYTATEQTRQGKYPRNQTFDQHFPKVVLDGPFGHLLNFFRTESPATQPEAIPGLARVMDLVTVDSPYVGGETWLNPVSFGGAPVSLTADPRYGLQPPFNRVASRREPGKININTIAAESVWNAIFQGDVRPNPGGNVHAGPNDNDLATTRRSYGPVTNKDPTLLDAASPTLFANPFRAMDSALLAPLDTMVPKNGASVLENQVTLLRSDASTEGGNGEPLLSTETTDNYRNADRNPFFRYSPNSRLSSMTTNRSNVFAIWVTVGFFEVEEVEPWADLSGAEQAVYGDEAVYNRVYPDGYRFGKEAGIDTGEVERVREFAIVDRTIPVGFEPGANHNIGETIRLRRRIE